MGRQQVLLVSVTFHHARQKKREPQEHAVVRTAQGAKSPRKIYLQRGVPYKKEQAGKCTERRQLLTAFGPGLDCTTARWMPVSLAAPALFYAWGSSRFRAQVFHCRWGGTRGCA